MRHLVSRYPQVFTLAATAALWEGVARLGAPAWLPPVSAVGAAWWNLVLSGQFFSLRNTAVTLAVGLAVVFAAAALLAILMSVSSLAEDALTPYLNAALSIPHVALVPVLILLWGLSDVTRVATVISFALAPLVAQWAAAAKDLPRGLLEMARSFDAGPARRLVSVILRAAAPMLLTGVRIAVVQGIKGVVSAEILIGVIGIGRLLQNATLTFDLASLYAVILTLLVLSIAVYFILEAVERRASRRLSE